MSRNLLSPDLYDPIAAGANYPTPAEAEEMDEPAEPRPPKLLPIDSEARYIAVSLDVWGSRPPAMWLAPGQTGNLAGVASTARRLRLHYVVVAVRRSAVTTGTATLFMCDWSEVYVIGKDRTMYRVPPHKARPV